MKEKLQLFLFIMIQIVFGGLIGAFGAFYFISFLEIENTKNVLLMLFVLMSYYTFALVLHIMIHECGHLIFGLLTGYQFVSIRFGNLMIIKTEDGLKLKKYSLAGTGGQCLLAPPFYNNGNYSFILYNLGGCLFNLLFSLISFILFNFEIYPWINAFFLIFALCGLMTSVTNGIPIKTKEITNDGSNVIELLKNNASKEAFWKQMRINELASKNIRLKNMPQDLFRIDTDIKQDNALTTTIEVFEIQYYMDQGNFEIAKKHIIDLLRKQHALIGIHQHLLINDLIYLYVLENNVDAIEDLMTKEHKKMRKAMRTNLSFLRTDYALDLLYHRFSNAYNLFQKQSKTYPLQIDIDSETELLERVKGTFN